jgi:hypothetical protein
LTINHLLQQYDDPGFTGKIPPSRMGRDNIQ